MTAVEHVSEPCAVCGADTLTLPSSGNKFCPSCGAEYDPENPPARDSGPAGDAPVADPAGAAEVVTPMSPTFVTVVRVTGTDPETGDDIEVLYSHITDVEHTVEDAETAAMDDARHQTHFAKREAAALSREIEEAEQAARTDLAHMVGTEVRLVDGRVGTIVGFPDDDTMSVRLADGEVVEADYDDVTGSVATPSAAGPVTIDVPDDVGLEMAEVNLTFATLALRAGLRSLEGDEPPYGFGMPATGWIPPDVDALPLVEQGTAYAIAILVAGLGIPKAEVEHIVDDLLSKSEVDLTKGENHDEQ